MTDPRFTDPRYNDPQSSDPVLRRDASAAGGMWGWIAGVAVLLLMFAGCTLLSAKVFRWE